MRLAPLLCLLPLGACLPPLPAQTARGEAHLDAGRASPEVDLDGGVDAASPIDAANAPQPEDAGGGPALTPPRGAGSGGTGGTVAPGVLARMTAGGIAYRLIVPQGSAANARAPLVIVYSGSEGAAAMAQNLVALEATVPTLGRCLRAVLDGVTYAGDGQAGAAVLDDVRSRYDVDNDRTYLLGESEGTTGAFALGYHLRQSAFAAYWVNDPIAAAADGPAQHATQLGFRPWAQVGPGGATSLAQAIAAKLTLAGYRTDAVTPYASAGADTHGAIPQFVAAITWLDGKTR